MSKYRKTMLVILDGFGINYDLPEQNPILIAETPTFDALFSQPHAKLLTHGEYVGLPKGQVGGSEVGHLTLGAGSVIKQTIVRVDELFTDAIEKHQAHQDLLSYAQTRNKRIHIMMVFSPQGVHSHIRHLEAFLETIPDDTQVFFHFASDGRDSPPKTFLEYYKAFQKKWMHKKNLHLATVVGRFYMYDRDTNWNRVQVAYDAMVNGSQSRNDEDLETHIQASYNQGITDEFMLPLCFGEDRRIRDGDVLVNLNFRADRGKQITQTFIDESNPARQTKKLDIHYVPLFKYYQEYEGPYFLDEGNVHGTLPEVLANCGATQFHTSETNKFIHVTKFFGGLHGDPVEGQVNKKLESYKVTFDKRPEMKAQQLFEIVRDTCMDFDFTLVNFPNGDMVGHTGKMPPALIAVKTLDSIVSQLLVLSKEQDIDICITADHGNIEIMGTPEQPHTSHTFSAVPFWYIRGGEVQRIQKEEGTLVDVAPTVLKNMGIPQPSTMTGISII